MRSSIAAIISTRFPLSLMLAARDSQSARAVLLLLLPRTLCGRLDDTLNRLVLVMLPRRL
jgi:hypothetical protein